MEEKLALFTLNDLKQLGISLGIEYSKDRKADFIEKIYNALSKKTDTEQYEILKKFFIEGKFDVIYFKREPSSSSADSNLIIPSDKKALFNECIVMVDEKYIICAKKRLQNQSLTFAKVEKSLKKHNLEGHLIFGKKITHSMFLALKRNDAFKFGWENANKKYVALYCSYASNDELLTIHSKLSSNNEIVKKQIKDTSQEKVGIDDLNINIKLQNMEENKRILVKHFITNYPKELINKITSVGINILETANNETIRYKIILKSNHIFTIENIDTTLDDIKNILHILTGLDDELKKQNF